MREIDRFKIIYLCIYKNSNRRRKIDRYLKKRRKEIKIERKQREKVNNHKKIKMRQIDKIINIW